MSSRALRSTLGRICSFHQILEKEKLLLILFDRDRVFIYLERLPEMDIAIQRERPVKCLNREKLGEGPLFAFDETKRALVVCSSTKVLHRQSHWPRRAELMSLVISYNSIYLFLMKATRRFRAKDPRLISPRGIDKQKLQSYMQLSYVGMKKSS